MLSIMFNSPTIEQYFNVSVCACFSDTVPEEERAKLLKKAAATTPPKRLAAPTPYKSKAAPQQATRPLSRIRSQAKTRR